MFVVVNKKGFAVICMSVLAVGLGIGGVINLLPSKQTFGNDGVKTVVIDAGHGGVDGGAVGYSGTVESDINFEIAKKVEEILATNGINVVMTRETKDGVKSKNEKWDKISDMKLRRKIVEDANADLFVSIHMNHFSDKNVHGLHIFYSSNSPEIKDFAEELQRKISDVTGAKANAVMTADKRIYLMKNSPCPAILVECGFLSNPDEEKKLKNEEYRSEIAWGIAESVETFFEDLIKNS